jgi:hypothetical protein
VTAQEVDIMRTRISGGLLATLLALAVAVPAAAATPAHWGYTDVFDAHHDCGIVEHVRAGVKGSSFFAADGSWLRDIVRYQYDSVFESTITGHTMTSSGRQIAEYTPDGLTQTAQGFFLRGAGGVLVFDVGRLVLDWDGGTTFRTPKSIAFDDDAAIAAFEATLCAALG